MKRIAVYGTLRKGDYNYERCIGYTGVSLGSQTIEGFDMYSLGGSYPAIVKGEGSIQVEVMDVPDDVAERIDRMEGGAGYLEATVDTEFGKAKFYYMDKAPKYSGTVKIPSGDWFEHLKETDEYRFNRIQGALAQ